MTPALTGAARLCRDRLGRCPARLRVRSDPCQLPESSAGCIELSLSPVFLALQGCSRAGEVMGARWERGQEREGHRVEGVTVLCSPSELP